MLFAYLFDGPVFTVGFRSRDFQVPESGNLFPRAASQADIPVCPFSDCIRVFDFKSDVPLIHGYPFQKYTKNSVF